MLIHKTERFTTPRDEACGDPSSLSAAVEIYSPLVALDMLMYRWPEEHGPEYEEARRTCLDAIAGRCDIEKARESFPLRAAMRNP